MLGDYYDKWVGYQFELQKSSLQNFNLAKERQFELFKSMRLWDKMEPVDYDLLVKNNYYNSWLTFTEGAREWETKKFRDLNKKNNQLINLLDKEIKRSN